MRYTVPLEVDDPLAVPSNRKGYIAPGSLVDDKCPYDYDIMGRHKYKLIFYSSRFINNLLNIQPILINDPSNFIFCQNLNILFFDRENEKRG